VRKVFFTLAGGEIGARSLQVLAVVLLTRKVGMGSIGDYGLATSIAAYALLLVNQGYDTIAVRASAQKDIEARRAAEAIIGLRLVAALAITAATGLWTIFRQDDPAARLLLILSGSYFSAAITPRWFYLARSRPRPLAAAATLSQACLFIGVLTVRGPADLSRAAWAQVAGEAATAIYLWTSAGCFRPRLKGTFWRFLMAESWPVTLSLIMGTALYNFDLVALGLFGRRVEVGPYLSVYRCITVFNPLLAALQGAILPRFAEGWPDFKAIRSRVEFISIGAFSTLALTAAFLFLFAPGVLRLLYGPEIGQSASLLRILVWMLPLWGLRAVLRQALYAFRGQRADLRNVTLSALTNMSLDLALIPYFGAVGCAWSTLVAESVFLAGTWFALAARVVRSSPHPEGATNGAAE
jgi:O-antigen/teichoic acid export membrane protein